MFSNSLWTSAIEALFWHCDHGHHRCNQWLASADEGRSQPHERRKGLAYRHASHLHTGVFWGRAVQQWRCRRSATRRSTRQRVEVAHTLTEDLWRAPPHRTAKRFCTGTGYRCCKARQTPIREWLRASSDSQCVREATKRLLDRPSQNSRTSHLVDACLMEEHSVRVAQPSVVAEAPPLEPPGFLPCASSIP